MIDEARRVSRSGVKLPVPNSVARASLGDQDLEGSTSSLTSPDATAAASASISASRLGNWQLPRRLQVATDTRILREILSGSAPEMKKPKTDDAATLVQQIRQEAKGREEEINSRIYGTGNKDATPQESDAAKESKTALPPRTFSFQQVMVQRHTTYDALVASIRQTETEDPLRTFGPKQRYSRRNSKTGLPVQYTEN
ncbi:uncharacterized protein LOC126344189 isoform X1 [Schistocerca gregaria]|uniref:uncharacterized protein LOC126344189 isoform X1 n=1 Tax=Schistocerca gregaria TaxID=7010 RepID=UPI00211DC336|nr:uncharacterized protein LOC126344189 isoform X1 [Schistocerca gregaria]